MVHSLGAIISQVFKKRTDHLVGRVAGQVTAVCALIFTGSLAGQMELKTSFHLAGQMATRPWYTRLFQNWWARASRVTCYILSWSIDRLCFSVIIAADTSGTTDDMFHVGINQRGSIVVCSDKWYWERPGGRSGVRSSVLIWSGDRPGDRPGVQSGVQSSSVQGAGY